MKGRKKWKREVTLYCRTFCSNSIGTRRNMCVNNVPGHKKSLAPEYVSKSKERIRHTAANKSGIISQCQISIFITH